MSQKQTRKKNEKQSAAALWWRPFFNMQQEVNRNMQRMIPGFLPMSFWNTEENMLDRFQKNVHGLYSQMFNNRQMLTPWWQGNQTEPYVDIIEGKDGYTVKADVPGVDADDLNISITESALTIRGTRDDYKEKKGDIAIRRECCCGAFSRTIALPEDADLDNASASFERNVLVIKVPKTPAGQTRPDRPQQTNLKIATGEKEKTESKTKKETKPAKEKKQEQKKAA